MRAMSLALRHELVGLGGVIERNIYLVKRYIWWDIAFFLWTVANTLTIVFIAKGIPAAGGKVDVQRLTAILLVGAVIWAYLGIIFEILTETVAWERWEGTIEYTFMAPLSRPVHLIGMGLFAIGYGVIRASLLFGVVAAFFGLHLHDANYAAAKFASGIERPKNIATTTNRSVARTRPYSTANTPEPPRCIARESGAMNVYSIVPSHRSQATVSVMNSKMIPR